MIVVTLCVKRYKAGFCWGMQQSVFFCNFSIAACGELPIMRLHRTADVNHFTQTAGSVEEKNPEFRVDSERGKRNIRHLATVSESRVATAL